MNNRNEDLGFVWRLLLVLLVTTMTYMIIFKILMYFIPFAFILLLLCIGMYMMYFTIYDLINKYIHVAINACKKGFDWLREKKNAWIKTDKTAEASNQEATSAVV